MSLKLDELRKRLLQQQLGRDGAAPEPSPGPANGKVLNVAPPTVEPGLTPKVLEQPVVSASAPEPAAAAQAPEPHSVESKMSATEAPVTTVESRPSDAEISDKRESASSLSSEPESEVAKSRLGAAAIAPGPVGQHELADAVGKVFEQTKAFQARLEDLGRIFEPIDRMGNSAVRAFAPLRGFQQQMAQLARSFEPMRTFQQQLSQLAQN